MSPFFYDDNASETSYQLPSCELVKLQSTPNEENVSAMISDAIRQSAKTEISASVSGDEVETATSSDIEIISSPQSGMKKIPRNTRDGTTMTHHREPSEASSAASDESLNYGMETDKMGRRVAELVQLLEVYNNPFNLQSQETLLCRFSVFKSDFPIPLPLGKRSSSDGNPKKKRSIS